MQTELDYLRQKVPFLENIIASLETEKAEWYHQKMQFETKIAELNKIIDNLVLKNKALNKNVAEKQSQLNDIDINSMLDVDFDRDFDGDPPATNSFDQGGSDSSSQGVTKQRKRRKNPDPQAWEQNVNKKMREEGKAYKGKVKVDGKWQYQAERRARELQPPCQCKMSENSKGKLWCNKFTEEHRKYIFDMFWSKSWEEKRKAVQTYVRVDEPSDCRNRKNEISRRKNTFFYRLPDETGTLRPVCKNQFWNTLDIRGHMVAKMIEKQDEEVESEQEDTSNL
uniref:Uncharacterized protein n=1 Tax=Lutzomyia longipalpis TaxID=7200 RepID=A0A1B0CAG2_LUTLO